MKLLRGGASAGRIAIELPSTPKEKPLNWKEPM
eukprot:CAMPEP_0174744250 /NCGR_PEP_ID=MMETSP1094-20130205/83781_1 /TAXON_ID=156173 /ORGANISM="Chrysochromulina brevifilum, Strain UTEX LB 985" /LENGTH=32 /DNA_ID= /DNA_START= /DNA_END= /DNA_ORIENTATION=